MRDLVRVYAILVLNVIDNIFELTRLRDVLVRIVEIDIVDSNIPVVPLVIESEITVVLIPGKSSCFI